MGFVFVLDRATGRPVIPVTEQPVPPSDVPDENASPTQPIPAAPPPLVPQRLTANDAWGLTFIDRLLCRRKIAALRSEGLYTPPSLRGSIIYPFAGGGVNWGGGAFDPDTGIFIVNSMNVAHVVRLIPRADYAAARAAEPKAEIGAASESRMRPSARRCSRRSAFRATRRPGARWRPSIFRPALFAGRCRLARRRWAGSADCQISAARS
jgi:quinoprotein glucose dehydrogenase